MQPWRAGLVLSLTPIVLLGWEWGFLVCVLLLPDHIFGGPGEERLFLVLKTSSCGCRFRDKEIALGGRGEGKVRYSEDVNDQIPNSFRMFLLK